jgi:hypothetical protein
MIGPLSEVESQPINLCIYPGHVSEEAWPGFLIPLFFIFFRLLQAYVLTVQAAVRAGMLAPCQGCQLWSSIRSH